MARRARLVLSPRRVILSDLGRSLRMALRSAALRSVEHRTVVMSRAHRRWAVAVMLAISAFAASPSADSPIYLQCQLGLDGQATPATAPFDWEISLDETRGSVEWVRPQASGREEGSFSAREVRWTKTMGGVANNFAINRSTLAFTRTASVGDHTLVASGRCRVVAPPRRAF